MTKTKITVVNQYGAELNFEAVLAFMDEEICEEIHRELAPTTPQAFYNEYCIQHYLQYTEEFEPDKLYPVW